MKSVLLDTNGYSRYCKGDINVQQIIRQASRVYFSSVSLGELYLGFKEGNKESKNVDILKSFIQESKVKVVDIRERTAFYYSQIKFKLRKKGTPIPDNDIWIAASALETKSTLVTYDRHFLKITSLKSWKELD